MVTSPALGRLRMKAVDDGALVLVSNRSGRVPVTALIDALFALRVVRIRKRECVEGAGEESFVAPVEEIEHEIAQIGDQVAVAAERLIEAFAAVNLRPLVMI